MFDVFFYEAFTEEQKALNDFLPIGVRAGWTWKTIQERGRTEPESGFISIRTQSTIPLAWAGKLRAILSRSTGYDHLLNYRHQVGLNLPCGYLPLYCRNAVAEHALMLWMALLRKLPLQMRQFRTFNRDGLTGVEARERVLLVVGVGNIGYEIVRLGRGIGMRVFGVDIVRKYADVNYRDFSEVAPAADVVVCAMNLTDVNRGYFNEFNLAGLKPGAIFVNVSRGELSPPAELLKMLESGRLGGVGLDVFDCESNLAPVLRERRNPDNPSARAVLKLAGRQDVILTPHNAFNSGEAVMRKSEQSMLQVSTWLEQNRFLWPIPAELLNATPDHLT